jgi:hypothetical protein
MITETLGSDSHRSFLISDSALKVVFLTTLYVDVKEPAIHVHFRPQKKLNLVSAQCPAFAQGYGGRAGQN